MEACFPHQLWQSGRLHSTTRACLHAYTRACDCYTHARVNAYAGMHACMQAIIATQASTSTTRALVIAMAHLG